MKFMEALIQALEKISQIPGAKVDKEEDSAAYAHLLSLFQKGEDSFKLNNYIAQNLRDVQVFIDWIKPHKFPVDFLFFQASHIQIQIMTGTYLFAVLEPEFPVEPWMLDMGANISGANPNKNGLMTVGSLTDFTIQLEDIYNPYPETTFVISLDDVFVPKYSVIAVSLGDPKVLQLREVLHNPEKYRDKWAVVGNSFTHWIELIAEAQGKLTWLPLGNNHRKA
jgi:hypothetical protein